jgi:hypothetical protein
MKDKEQTPVFGLSKPELKPIVENVAGEKVISFNVEVVPHEWAHYGVRGEKLVVHFDFITHSRDSGHASVFVKLQGEPGGRVGSDGRHEYPSPVEAHHYRWLSRHGASIPQMFGALTVCVPDEREVLFLENLHHVVEEEEPWPQFQSNAKQFHSYLSALAYFNAIDPMPEYRKMLPHPHRHFCHQMSHWTEKIDRLWSCAKQGMLGQDVKTVCSEENRRRIHTLETVLKHDIGLMPMGLSAGDQEPWQSGSRLNGEAVLFDFELVGFAPRFYDPAVTLGAPEGFCPRCGLQEELAKFYLDIYCRHSKSSVPLQKFLTETRTLWLTWTLGWIEYSYRVDLDGRAHCGKLLYRNLLALLRACDTFEQKRG